MKTSRFFSMIAVLLFGITATSMAADGYLAFGTNDTKINAATVNANDNLANSWTITVSGTTSFTQSTAYSQIGSKDKPASSITLSTTFSSAVTLDSASIKLGGFASTAGTVTIKAGSTTLKTGSLNATADVIVSATTSTNDVTNLTITITSISRGVKIYSLAYSIAEEEKDPRTYTLYPGTGTISGSGATITRTESAYGDGITLPNPDAPEGCDPAYTFAGWATATVTETTTAPTLYTGDYDGDDLTLYAVYKQTDGDQTNEFTLAIGTTYVGLRSTGNAYMLTTNATGAAHLGITEKNGEKYLYFLNGSTPTYISSKSDNSNLSFNTSITDAIPWTVTESGANITLRSTGDGNRYLGYNSSVSPARFAAYANNASYPHSFTKTSLANFKYNSNPSCACTGISITYNPAGGTMPADCGDIVGADCGLDWVLCGAPTYSGHIFAGWKDGKGSLYEAGASVYDVRHDMTLTAQWLDNPYTVYFDAGSGTTATTQLIENARGEGVKLPKATPAAACAADWTFVGWAKTQLVGESSTSVTLVGSANSIYIPSADNETLYAVYSMTDAGSGSTATYSKYTASSIVSGDYVIVACQTDGSYCQLPHANMDNGRIPCTSDYTTLPASISAPDMNNVWRISVLSDGKITLFNVGQDVYLGAGSTGKLTYATQTSALSYTVTYSGSGTYGKYSFAYDTYYLGVNTSAYYFRNYAKSTIVDQYNITLYKGSAGTTYYSTSPTCEECIDPEAYFVDGEVITKTRSSATYTNPVAYRNANAGLKTYKSSDENVATVNASTGEVTIHNVGTTTISLRQPKTSGKCAVQISYTLEVVDPTIEVVGVTADKGLIIEHDIDGETEIVLLENQTTIDGNVAEDIFFSKYFEAASNMKLFAVFNGTDHDIDLSLLRVRCGATAWPTHTGELGYVEFKNISQLGLDYPGYMLPPGKELIFWSNNWGTAGTTGASNNQTLRECITMTINGISYTYADMEEGLIANWYCLGDPRTYNTRDADGNNQFTFNGDDALILERNTSQTATPDWEPIDLIGAGTAAAPTDAGVKEITTKYTIDGVSQPLNDNPGGFYCTPSGASIPLSTNRYMLIRKKEVLSGQNAVESNTNSFATLCTEWNGTPVGGSTSSYCYSGKCFADIAQYDYANFYSEYVEIESEKLHATDNGDGTVTINISDLDERACTYLRIQVRDHNDPDNIAATTDYKVPIVVKSGTKMTTDQLFTEQNDACAACDVVVLENATLQKANDAAMGDKSQIRDLYVYPNAHLNIPTGTNYRIRNLILRAQMAGDGLNVNVPDALVSGHILSTGKVQQQLRLGTTRFYAVVFPYNVRLSDVVYSNGESAIYGEDFMIRYYDGQQRATTATASKSNWVDFTGNELQAGIGYQLAIKKKAGHTQRELIFPLRNANLSEGEAPTKEVRVYDWGAGMDIRPNHKGWNFIGNPYMTTYARANIYTESDEKLTLGQLVPDPDDPSMWTNNQDNIPYVTISNAARTDYSQYDISLRDLPPFTTFAVQVGNDVPAVSDLKITFQRTSQRSLAPQYLNPTPNTTHKLGLLLVGDEEQDNFGIVIGEQYTNAYEMQADLVKEFGTAYSLKAYSMQDDMMLAYNALSPQMAGTAIPVGFRTPLSTDYIFRLDNRYDWSAFEHVYLTDNQTGTVTDLMTDDYTFASIRQQVNNRFYLSIILRDVNVTTDLSGLSGVIATVQQGQVTLSNLPYHTDIYIYDTAGRMLVRDHIASDLSHRYALPTGVYQIRIEAKQGREIKKIIIK